MLEKYWVLSIKTFPFDFEFFFRAGARPAPNGRVQVCVTWGAGIKSLIKPMFYNIIIFLDR
jgi:hypothetical protein